MYRKGYPLSQVGTVLHALRPILTRRSSRLLVVYKRFADGYLLTKRP